MHEKRVPVHNDPAGHAIETIAPSGLRTGTIYYPDGEVEYTGPLTATALDADQLPVVDGAAGYTLSDFASYTAYTYNQYDADLGLFYSSVTDQNGHETDTYKDALGRTIRTVFDDGSFTETLYSFGTTPVSQDQEGNALALPQGVTWTNNLLPSGDQEVVQIAQRQAGDPLVRTSEEVGGTLVTDPTSGLTASTKTYYDPAGHAIETIAPSGRRTGTVYYPDGEVEDTGPLTATALDARDGEYISPARPRHEAAHPPSRDRPGCPRVARPAGEVSGLRARDCGHLPDPICRSAHSPKHQPERF